ncbi:poly(ADP-ribose) glycohydrolase-like isoform X2 [Gigantopelta aegis]|uniref:poly(ADP-ribose) glycohydrolase-like isoform X2 n=1 Tax=Gigantopelta aegis TaxID=1735272 RepID=UPI001B88C938|nr:poly(ADP-ribose) glycohydrolase-like isoform X2 [Gigantopelta aegis]
MMSKPAGRKLRQTTLDFVTSNKSELKKRKMATCTKDIGDFEDISAGKDDRAEKRMKAGAAADKRRETKSPYFTNPSAVCTTTGENQLKVHQLAQGTSAVKDTKQLDKPDLTKRQSDQSTSDAGNDTSTQQYSMTPDFGGSDFEDISSAADQPSPPEADTHNPRHDEQSDSRIPNKKPVKKGHWKGVEKSELDTVPKCQSNFQPLKSSDKHIVTFALPYQYDVNHTTKPPKPHPLNYIDKWDADHVRMPCSNENQYPTETKGKTRLQPRWNLIQESLLGDLSGPFELEDAILSYNQRYKNKWSFRSLRHYFMKHTEDSERFEFFGTTLKAMVELALKLPYLCTKPIPLLKRGQSKSISMSQEQVACLLANAFFCTFPRRNTKNRNAEYSSYPDINFNNLFQDAPTYKKMQKLQCIIHYFKRVTTQVPLGVVTYTRQSVSNCPDWNELTVNLPRLHVSSDGTIEDDGKGMLQVDFANKVIGGGVLRHGCVQEEIRFLICPEMLLTLLFTETLDKNESVIMLGCEQFSEYKGYADTFSWDGNHYDKTSRDINGHLCTEVVAIDALVIHKHCDQFQPHMVARELNKAYSGFCSRSNEPKLPAVCTGNWGCGAFGGDKKLKALIQLFAAAAARRDVCYFTFEDENLVDELYEIHKYLTEENPLEIGHIMKIIHQYYLNVCKKTFGKPQINLFDYIIGTFEGTLEDTDADESSSHSCMESCAKGELKSSVVTNSTRWQLELRELIE